MIPIIWFLVVWFVMLGLFALLTAVTLFMHFRFGLTGSGIFASSTVFLGVVALVLILSAIYLFQVDWSQSLEIMSSGRLRSYDLNY